MKVSAASATRWLAPCLPLGLLLLACGASSSRESGSGVEAGPRPGVVAAGFKRVTVAGRGGSYRGVDSSRAAGGVGRRLSIRLPSQEGAAYGEQVESVITVAKSNLHYDVDFSAGRERWRYLSAAVRRQIDLARAEPGRWKYIVVHNSATASGNARAFDYHHRNVKKMEDGLAYHFVIGNGSWSGDGEVEVGHRWVEQLEGGGVHGAALDGEVIGVCLVGDFNREKVGRAQLEALDELVDYVQAKVGAVTIATHQGMSVEAMSCPGRFFPQEALR